MALDEFLVKNDPCRGEQHKHHTCLPLSLNTLHAVRDRRRERYKITYATCFLPSCVSIKKAKIYRAELHSGTGIVSLRCPLRYLLSFIKKSVKTVKFDREKDRKGERD